jgi:excisionase family DNA binding protein
MGLAVCMSTQALGRANKLHASRTGLPALLTIGQVAEATGLSTKTIRRRVADRTLRAVRVGPKAIRIERDSVLDLLRPLGGAV